MRSLPQKIESTTRLEHLSTVAGYAALVVAVMCQLVYTLHFYRRYFNSDDAVVNMLAESMWQQGRLLPHDWISYNGDLMIPSGALIVAPLLNFLPNGFHLHAVVGVFAMVSLLLSLGALLTVLRMPRAVLVLLVTLGAYAFSITFAEMVFQQATYLWWPMGFLLGAALIGRSRLPSSQPPRHGRLIPFALFALVFSISFANPGRVAVMMVAPLYAFDWVLRANRRHDGDCIGSSPRKWLSVCGLDDALTAFGLGCAFACAAILYVFLRYFEVTQSVRGVTDLRWGGWPSVWVHVHIFASGWIYYLGVDSAAVPAKPFEGFIWMLRACVPGALTCIGLSELIRLRANKDVARRALGAALVVAFVPILGVYLLFEPLASEPSTVRYFTVPMFILAVLSAFPLRDLLRKSRRVGSFVLAAAGVVLALVAVHVYIPTALAGNAPFWQVRDSKMARLASLLQEEGLRWGYATWWNAGATTVLADSAVRVSPVVLETRGILPTNSMVSKRWYQPSAWTGETFLVLAANESDQRTLDFLNVTLGDPKRVIESADYHVLVYDRNIASEFGCFSGIRLDTPVERSAPGVRIESAAIITVGDSPLHLLTVHIRNGGRTPVSGIGRSPLSVGVRLLDASGKVVAPDWLHAPLICPLMPGEERAIKLALPKTADGAWRVRVDLVQEGVAWFQNLGVTPLDLALDDARDMRLDSRRKAEIPGDQRAGKIPR